MAKSASPEELRMMRSQPTEAMKMTMFYRYWCLKEAILKATGVGIMKDLNSLDFRVNMQDRYRPGKIHVVERVKTGFIVFCFQVHS